MATSIALFGAGGKMGLRITDRLKDAPNYDISYVEPAEDGREALAGRGITTSSQAEALDDADVVVLAVPDDVISGVTDQIVPEVESGTMVMLLDPAAAYAGVLPGREDVTYFITHPCHPPVFKGDRPEEFADDWFGGNGKAEQDIVCALHQGPESDYERGERIARDMTAPVRRVHRLTTEQMALLEPALAESLVATLIDTIYVGMEDVVEMGVPEEAAYDFLMGHIRIELAVIFGLTDFPFSDAAQKKMTEARSELLQNDWKEILSVDRTKESVRDIAGIE